MIESANKSNSLRAYCDKSERFRETMRKALVLIVLAKDLKKRGVL